MSNPKNQVLDFDELIAVIVAFGTIGTLLWWGLSRNITESKPFQFAPSSLSQPSTTVTPAKIFNKSSSSLP